MTTVDLNEVNTEEFITDDVVTRDVPGNGKGKYSFMRVKYKYGDQHTKKGRSCVIDFPRGVADYGLQVETDEETGRVSYKMRYVPLNVSSSIKLLEKTSEMEEWAANKFAVNKVAMANLKGRVTAAGLLENGLTRIMYRKENEETGEYIDISDSNLPSKFLKLDAGTVKPEFKTKFRMTVGKDENGDPIIKDVPWEALYNKRVTFEPALHFYRLCSSGSGQSFQSTLKSALIISIEDPPQRELHKEKAKELAKDDEYLKQSSAQYEAALKLAAESGINFDDPTTIPSDEGTSGESKDDKTPPTIDPLKIVQAVTGGGSSETTPTLSTTLTPPTLESFVSTSKDEKSGSVGIELPPGVPVIKS